MSGILVYLEITVFIEMKIKKIKSIIVNDTQVLLLLKLGHLSHSSDLLLCVGVCHRASSVYIFFSRTTEPILTKVGMSHLQCKETRNCKFHDTHHHPKREKFMYFFKNLLLYSGACFRQTKHIVIMTKEGSTKIVNFMTLRGGIFVLGRDHIDHKVKMRYFSKNHLL